MTPRRERLDRLLVARGIAESREKAQAMIMAGEVLVNGQKALKSGQLTGPEASLEVLGRPRYVSRGGVKLEAALDQFHVDPSGKVCVDIGASTGGFTDCLLQHGAARVYAFDVGTNQLDWKLRSDPRVIARENINARYLTRQDIAELAELAVCDVSFISVTLILPAVAQLLRPEGEMIVLVKPQFESERGQVGQGGIVRDPDVHRAACDRVRLAAEALGFETRIIDSPILGGEGNREFLLYAHR